MSMPETSSPTLLREVSVLLVEDDEDDFIITRNHLHKVQTTRYDIDWIASPNDTFERLAQKHYDVILVDHQLGNKTGVELLRELKDAKISIPVLMLTGLPNVETDLEAMEAGASDYLVKSQLTANILERSIRYAIQHHQTLKALADSERTKELFYAAIAHDLKTPIFGERKILEHLKSETFGPLTEAQHGVLQELIHSNHYLYQMVTNLLTSYKYQHNQIQLKKSPVEYNELIQCLVREQLAALAKDKGQMLELVLDPEVPVVYIDPVEIQRVVFNLVHNALNYSPEHSLVVLRTIFKSEVGEQPATVVTQVEDHGIGIQAEQIPRLFQPYSTVKTLRPVGTGLGLYLSRQIIESHDGHIGVTSTPGVGSCFYFEFPMPDFAVEI